MASKQRLLSVKDILVKEDQIFEENASEDITTWESQGWEVNTNAAPDWETEANDFPVALAVDYMGGLDSRSAPRSIVIDDDEYYDPDEKLLEESDDEEFNDAFDQDVPGEHTSAKSYSAYSDSGQNEKDDQEPVILEESPLPRMFVPGKIAHIYSHRGVYKAVYVPRDFRELRRVSLAGNMLSDHKCKNYYEALLEVRTVRRAQEAPPRWTAFDEDDTWYVSYSIFIGKSREVTQPVFSSCCASRFTWASTFNNEAQEARDKHNCRSCGTLVCDQCAQNRVPLPSIGLTVPVRICDRCYYDIDGVVGSSLLTQSLVGSLDDVSNERDDKCELPERQRLRRSTVVDELAARVKANGDLST
jgi:hypothetical protein